MLVHVLAKYQLHVHTLGKWHTVFAEFHAWQPSTTTVNFLFSALLSFVIAVKDKVHSQSFTFAMSLLRFQQRIKPIVI